MEEISITEAKYAYARWVLSQCMTPVDEIEFLAGQMPVKDFIEMAENILEVKIKQP